MRSLHSGAGCLLQRAQPQVSAVREEENGYNSGNERERK